MEVSSESQSSTVASPTDRSLQALLAEMTALRKSSPSSPLPDARSGSAVATLDRPSLESNQPAQRESGAQNGLVGGKDDTPDPHKTQVLGMLESSDTNVPATPALNMTFEAIMNALAEPDQRAASSTPSPEASPPRRERFPKPTLADYEWREWQDEAIQTLDRLDAPQVQLSGERVIDLIDMVRDANDWLKEAQMAEYGEGPSIRTIDIAHAVENVGQEYLIAMHRKLFAEKFGFVAYEVMPKDVQDAFNTLCQELIVYYSPQKPNPNLEQAYTQLQSLARRYKAGSNPIVGMINGVRDSKYGEWVTLQTSFPDFVQFYQRTLRQSSHNFHRTSHGVVCTTFAPVRAERTTVVADSDIGDITEEMPIIPSVLLRHEDLEQHQEDTNSQRALMHALQITPDVVASRLHVFSLPLQESVRAVNGKMPEIDLQAELDWISQIAKSDRPQAIAPLWHKRHFVTLADIKKSSVVSKGKPQSPSLVDQVLTDSGQNFLLVTLATEINQAGQNLGLIVPAEFSNEPALTYLQERLPKNIRLIPLDRDFSQNLARIVATTSPGPLNGEERTSLGVDQTATIYDGVQANIPFADSTRELIGMFGTTHEEFFTNSMAQKIAASIYTEELSKLDAHASAAQVQAAFRRAQRASRHAWKQYVNQTKHTNNSSYAGGIHIQQQQMLEQEPTATVVKVVDMAGIDGQPVRMAAISYTGAQEVLKISPDGSVTRLTMDPNLQEAVRTKKMTFGQAQYVQELLDGIDSDASFAAVVREEVQLSIDEAYQAGRVVSEEIRDAEALLGMLRIQRKTGWAELGSDSKETLLKVLPSYLQKIHTYYKSRQDHVWATTSHVAELYEHVEPGDVVVVTSAASFPKAWADIYNPSLSLEQMLHEMRMHGSSHGKEIALNAVALRVGENEG